jgi:hypothetical protein
VCTAEDRTAGVQFLARTRDIPLFHSVQIGSGVHPASNSMGLGKSGGALSPGVKRLENLADHSPPSSAELKNYGALTPLHSHTLISQCLINKRKENFGRCFYHNMKISVKFNKN